VNSQVKRAAMAYLIVRTNHPHILLAEEVSGLQPAPLNKLMQKTEAWLRGELKSEANLLRFFEEFCSWRDTLPEPQNLNDQIVQLVITAMYATIEALMDPECDDSDLLNGAVNDIYSEIQDEGADTMELQEYFTGLQNELNAVVSNTAVRPLPKTYFELLKEADASLFGLGR